MDDRLPGSLHESLRNFLNRVSAAVEANPFVDVPAAERITGELGRVLVAWDRLSASQRQLVVDTVEYVAAVEDEEHDLLSPIGLVDDEERVTKLVANLGTVLDAQ